VIEVAKKKSKQKASSASSGIDDAPRGDDAGAEFRRQAEGRQSGVVDEMLYMLSTNKMWWLAPILVVLMILGAVIVLGGTAAAPFIYTLF